MNDDETDYRLSAEAWNSDPDLNEAIYGRLLDATDAGPFDGGCVVMAQALQMVLGGEIVALIGANGRAQHAVVAVGETYHDYNGSGPAEAFMAHFNAVERPDADHWIVAIGPLGADGLPGAPRSAAVAADIAALIKDRILAVAASASPGRPGRVG